MTRKVNIWWLALVAFATFLSSGVFLVSLLTTYAAETYSFRYGGVTSAYNWSMQRIHGSEGFCYGLWSCADNICQLGSLPNDHFVAVDPLSPYLNDSFSSSCVVDAVQSITWLWQWDMTKASFICLAIAICVEIIALTIFILTRDVLLSLSHKVIYYVSITLGPALMMVAHICAYVTMRSVFITTADSPPLFVIISQIITSVTLMIAIVCSHSLLRLPRRVHYDDDY